jgi:cobalt/nickel transport system permease protein
MHIPDGYLAPQTAVPVFAGMVPVWSVALRKIRKTLGERKIPVLSLCAAFSFVIMMFNAPVVGGSSAHAVGAVFIAILLGPWAATIAVSSALLIQALVFGDGGIISYGVNSLNMAVVMPFMGYLFYHLIAGKSKKGSTRNLVGALIGSYAGLNCAAFCAAVEFGIQPLLFHTAEGVALYCPYPLTVSIPAMMAAHLLVAGPIEAVITTVALAYVYKIMPGLSITGLPQQVEPVQAEKQKVSFLNRYKGLIIPLCVIVILTPIGLLATGTAWGEYSTDEIQTAIGYIPQGMKRLADTWKALLPDYSLPVFGNGTPGAVAGYIISAIVGILLIVALILVVNLLVRKSKQAASDKA